MRASRQLSFKRRTHWPRITCEPARKLPRRYERTDIFSAASLESLSPETKPGEVTPLLIATGSQALQPRHARACRRCSSVVPAERPSALGGVRDAEGCDGYDVARDHQPGVVGAT